MASGLDPNKAKTARRVIEVLEFFSEDNRKATVMDIVRRYKRPQSSTSELLASLVEMGLLYKDPASKFYTLTPRAAILGSLSQPSIVRDGRLLGLADQLQARTGLGVALMGMVGLNAQIFLWKPGAKPDAKGALAHIAGGMQERLCDSAAGLLLLSTLPQQRCDGVLRRLNAEAPAESKFAHAEMLERVQACTRDGAAEGAAGFGTSAHMSAVLLRSEPNDRPMAVAFIHETAQQSAELTAILREAVQDCVGQASSAAPAQVSNAA